MMFHYYIVVCVVIAFVYAELLTEPKMVFNKLYLFLERTLPEWLFYPVIGCSKCVSGQLALWFYVYKFRACQYDLVMHIFFICSSILITWLLSNLKRILER